MDAAGERAAIGWVATSLLIIVMMLSNAGEVVAIDHSGTCSGTFAAADNPHCLTGNCTVPAGQTLTIQPGVILVGQNFTLQINGALTAAGVAGNLISSSHHGAELLPPADQYHRCVTDDHELHDRRSEYRHHCWRERTGRASAADHQQQ